MWPYTIAENEVISNGLFKKHSASSSLDSLSEKDIFRQESIRKYFI